MANNDRARELATIARQVGSLFTRLSGVMQEWASELESSSASMRGNLATSSSIPSHTSDPSHQHHHPSLQQHQQHPSALSVIGGTPVDHTNPMTNVRKSIHNIRPTSQGHPSANFRSTQPSHTITGMHVNVPGLPPGCEPTSSHEHGHHLATSLALANQPPTQSHAHTHLQLHPNQQSSPPILIAPTVGPSQSLSQDPLQPHDLLKKRRDEDRSVDDAGRPKRTRVDWTEKENVVLFATLEKYSHLQENDLLQEIVKALNGTRTLFQTKGRFRNLLANGRIRSSDTVPKRWVVVPGRSGRRVRVNWSEEEDLALFECIRRFKHCEEDELLQEIVKVLKGSRTWFQAKGHFRNLLTSGKIRASDTIPAHWVVVDDSELATLEANMASVIEKNSSGNTQRPHQQGRTSDDNDNGDDNGDDNNVEEIEEDGNNHQSNDTGNNNDNDGHTDEHAHTASHAHSHQHQHPLPPAPQLSHQHPHTQPLTHSHAGHAEHVHPGEQHDHDSHTTPNLRGF